ncbi:MAG: tetratricopeptide repeat protein [Chloroflexota bacterium]
MRQLVPHFILEKYLANETRGSLPAAGIFVDLSGFSAMTDALARHGQLGAETLTQVMRGIFEPLVDAVYAQGGFVVGYAGDAFQAIFLEDAARAPAALRGLAAVAAIQEHTRAHPRVGTPFGEFPISLKAGLGYGEVTWLLMNSSDLSQATYCVRGSSVDNSVEAEENARPGQIVLDAASQARVAAWAEMSPAAAGFYRVERLLGELPAPHPFHMPQVDSATLGLFYPESVIHQPNAGEFRPVVNVFIDIPIDPTDESFVKPFMESVFLLRKRYDGFFLRPDLGDKGFNLLLFWGATTVHENNVERALNFLLDLYELTGISFRAGVSYRQAYSGFMGASVREDYTAYGWGVNLAARMMSASGQGEVWLEEEVARRAERHFSLHPLGAYSFKGFSDKIQTFALEGRKQAAENIYHGGMVGREAELDRWTEFIEPLRRGEFAGVLVIRGEAGIGKSRLVYECQHTPEGEALQWVLGQTDEILRQSLNPFEAWLRTRFQFSDDQTNEVNWRNFDNQLQSIIAATPDADLASELTRTRTVLAAQLKLFEPGSLYEHLDAKGRYENTFIALSTLIHAESLRKPLVLFIEDLHWLDEDTRSFLAYLVRNTLANPEKHYPLAILTTTRPEGNFPALNDPALLHEIQLQRLPSVGLSRLAEGILEGPASPSLTALLERRSEGNPFFAEQILRYLAENNLLLHLTDGTFSAAPRSETSIPTDVNSVLIARLDKLTREVREVVQTASVLGREFEVRLLAEMLRGDPHFADEVKSAERSDIWFALNELAYIFRHALLREAAYSMQLEARRRELHALAVEALEGIYMGELDSHYEELAYHSEQARLVEKALRYLEWAGDAARETYRNAEAMDYFTRVLQLTPSQDIKHSFSLLEKRIVVLERMAKRIEQYDDIKRMEEISLELGDNHKFAVCLKVRADYFINISDYQNAEKDVALLMDLVKSLDDMNLLLTAHTLQFAVLFRQGKFVDAMELGKKNLELARQSGNLLEQGRILTSIGQGALEMGDPDAVAQSYLDEAISVARKIQNRTLEAQAINNLANLAGFIKGDYASARKYFEQTLQISREQGDRNMQLVATVNLGWAASMLGDFDDARAYYTQALAAGRESGNRFTEAYTLLNLGSVIGIQGDGELALQSTLQALNMFKESGERGGEAWALFYSGQAALVQKKNSQSADFFRQSMAIRAELGLSSLTMEATAGLVQAALEKGELGLALQNAETILSHLATGGTLEGAEEPLRIYLACYLTLVQSQDARADAILQTAAAQLQSQIARIEDENARRRYVDNVPWRRAIWNAWNSANPRQQ